MAIGLAAVSTRHDFFISICDRQLDLKHVLAETSCSQLRLLLVALLALCIVIYENLTFATQLELAPRNLGPLLLLLFRVVQKFLYQRFEKRHVSFDLQLG